MTRTRRGPVAAVIAAVTAVAIYVWDDVLFAAPIVALATAIGPFPAFVLGSLVFGAVNFVVAILAVRAYDNRVDDRPSRLERWVTKQTEAPRGARARRLLAGGKAIGFVLSSFLLGGIVTTWLIRYSGHRDRIALVALASSTIFAVTFVGIYSGATRIVLNR